MECVPAPAVAGLKDDPEIPFPENVPPVGLPDKETAGSLAQYSEASPEKETFGFWLTVTDIVSASE
jgi:hypothetical protein